MTVEAQTSAKMIKFDNRKGEQNNEKERIIFDLMHGPIVIW